MKIKNLLIAVILAITTTSLSGCIFLLGAAGGGAAYAYIEGKYSSNVDGSTENVYNAAIEAVQNNSYYTFNEEKSKILKSGKQAKVYATTEDGTEIQIKIDKLKGIDSCKVTIKFGYFGDEAASGTLMNKIREIVKAENK